MLQRHRLLAALAAIGMIAVAVVGVRLSESGHEADLLRGSTNDTVTIRGGTVRVVEVRVGTGLKQYGKILPTTGMFVVVRVELAATGRDKITLQDAVLEARPDVTYKGYDLGGGVSAEPGFVTTTDLAYEVDPARIDDLTFELGPREIVSGYQQQVQVHLGITAANAGDWRAAAQGQVVVLATTLNRGIG